jgi:hypothetical protein
LECIQERREEEKLGQLKQSIVLRTFVAKGMTEINEGKKRSK